jgi:hypothetical protein
MHFSPKKASWGTGPDGLGVVTPPAGERAALQEEGRADARTIADGETLDVEEKTADFHELGPQGLEPWTSGL